MKLTYPFWLYFHVWFQPCTTLGDFLKDKCFQIKSTIINGQHNPTMHFVSAVFQLIGTAALIVCILAIVDPHNTSVPAGLEAFTVGLVVLVIGLSMGFNSGYAVNPARDLGPRLFTALAGWGSGVFT